MKPETHYVVKQHCRNAMIVVAEYSDRLKMLKDYPSIDKSKFLVIEHDNKFCTYNEIDGKRIIWEGMPEM